MANQMDLKINNVVGVIGAVITTAVVIVVDSLVNLSLRVASALQAFSQKKKMRSHGDLFCVE